MDVIPIAQSNASATNLKAKPAVPKKPLKLTSENDVNRTTHVRDMIRKLQEKEKSVGNAKPSLTKMGGRAGKIPAVPEKEEGTNGQASNQTIEDLKAIDEDIEKLRKQIEERDKIISALREAAEAKDKKLDNLMMEYSKLQSDRKLDLDTSPEPNRAASSSPSSPPLCNGELCWTDSFVNKNYHEPVYAQLLNDHAALQKVYNDLRSKLESQNEDFGMAKEQTDTPKTDAGNKLEGGENAINLIMAEQIKALKEREAQLIWEAEELREQNDLMEFRILELEECKKEFLDKEINEGKHRAEKIVWRERDLEEISDSGVMSLPTSEDLTSDSELGEAIRNYSPLGAVTNRSLSTPENSPSDPIGGGLNDLKQKKSLKSSECLQESGIFVDDCAIPAGTHSKACQTESVLDKTLLDLIDSSCDLFLSKNPGYLEDHKSDDLSTEISKLSVIQKRIQQKTKSPSPRGLNTVVSCPHSNSVLFYEERLAQLEDKLKIYESSGDTKDILLAKRLQKEVELAHRVKELTDKVSSLKTINKKLEEEKCEFEEAENDTRFQCQRLEIKLQELIDKNADLELELERQKVIMNDKKRKGKKKESLEDLITKYEQRNCQMEEKEEETNQRLNMIEAAMPACLAYNMLKIVHDPDIPPTVPSSDSDIVFKGKKRQSENSAIIQKVEEAIGEKKRSRKELEKAEDAAAKREKALRSKVEELEAKAAKDSIVIEEMSNSLKAFQLEEKSRRKLGSLRPDDVDLFEEIKQMVANEVRLRAEIDRLEKKEQAYMQSLGEADEIWAEMEADYKKRLQEAEEANSELQRRISLLEANQVNLEKALAEQPHLGAESLKKTHDFHTKIQELITENEKLKLDINQSLDEKFEEHRKFLENENATLKAQLREMEFSSAREEKKFNLLQKQLELTKKELEKERELQDKLKKDLEEKSESVTSIESKLQCQISDLNQELNQKSKELSSLEVTVAELREEVETLENKVTELVGTIQTAIKNQEEVSTNVSTEVPVPVSEPVRHDGVKVSLPKAEESGTSEEPTFELGKLAREVLVKAEKHGVETFILKVPEVVKEEEPDPREEEIFQLSLKNTELQQILERMEEESELKDKEFEELQKIALEIRREQKTLELLYGAAGEKVKANHESEKEKIEEPVAVLPQSGRDSDPGLHLKKEEEAFKKNPSTVSLPNKEPLAAKTPEDTSLSSLQIAPDNLQSKYRSKNVTIKSLLDELKQKGDNREIDDFAKFALETSSQPQMEEKNFEGHPRELISNAERNGEEQIRKNELHSSPELAAPKLPKKSSFGACSLLDSSSSSLKAAAEADLKVAYIPPIKTVRKVGDDGIFLEWDISRQPDNVTGFEIKVNGLLTHRVRSSTRNKALLRPLNLKENLSIRVLAISETGRSMRSSHFNYPKKVFSNLKTLG